MSYENILVETRGPVDLIALNRPQALKALYATSFSPPIPPSSASRRSPSVRSPVVVTRSG